MENSNPIPPTPPLSSQFPQPPQASQYLNQPSKPGLPDPGDLIKQAWFIYRKRFWLLLAISFLPTILMVACIMLFVGGAMTVSLLAVKFGLTGSITTPIIIAGVLLIILVYLAVLFLSFWAQTALVFAIKGADENIGFKESFMQASHKMLSFFGASFLSGLAIACSIIPFAILTAAAALLNLGMYSFLIGLIFLPLCVVLAIYLAVRFSMAVFVVVGDNTNAWPAMKRSGDYVSGYWWPVFGRLLFIFAFIFGLSFGVSFFFGTLGGIFRGSGSIIGASLGGIINMIISVTLPPLSTAYFYLIYKNLKSIKGESKIPADKSGPVWIIITALVLIIATLLGSVFFFAFRSSQSKSRDAQRLADARQLSSSLELYYNDNNKYPNSLNELTVTPNHFSNQPNYIGKIPAAPTPPDGSCTAAENTYTYTLLDPNHYSLNFCLGGAAGGYAPGINIMTEQGISGGFQTTHMENNFVNEPAPNITANNSTTPAQLPSNQTQPAAQVDCSQITDPLQNYECVLNQGIQKKDISVCNITPKGNYGITDWKDGCINAYAITNNEPELCNTLAPSSRYKTPCTSYFANLKH